MSAIILLIAVFAAANIRTSEGTSCKQKMDFALVMDRSSSVCGGSEPCENWNSAIRFSQEIVKSLNVGPDGTKVATIVFSNKTEVEWNLKKYTDTDSVVEAIGRIPFKGGEFTDIASAFGAIFGIFNPISGDDLRIPNVVLAITDGIPSISTVEAQAASIAVQQDGITLLVVCVAPKCEESWADAISTTPKPGHKTTFMVDNYSSLVNIKDVVAEEICAAIGG